MNIKYSISSTDWHQSLCINDNDSLIGSLANSKVNTFGASTSRCFKATVKEIIHECTFGWWLNPNNWNNINLLAFRNSGWHLFNKLLKENITKQKSFPINEIDLIGWFIKIPIIIEAALLILIALTTCYNLLNYCIGWDIQLLKLHFMLFYPGFKLGAMVFFILNTSVDQVVLNLHQELIFPSVDL